MQTGAFRALGGSAAILAAFAPMPAAADVKDGVDAWSRGDYAAAVAEWQAPADAGDPDAMFNLGQAYRLGRGVPMDLARAEALYAQAAGLGHLQAADTYGLMLFQDGRREEALPYVQDAARRGDPRSQYLLGIAYFNGDFVGRDWVRAYALVSLASSTGLPQAGPAQAQMDELIPLTQRQQAASLATQMRQEADAARGRELAAADLADGRASPVSATAPASGQARPPVMAPAAQQPEPFATVGVSPSVAAARAAVAQAMVATGTASPAEAGASYARPAPAPKPTPVPTTAVASAPVVQPTPAPPARATAPAAGARGGPWALQLGAFSVSGNADRLWRQLSGRAELSGAEKLLVPSGRVTKLLAAGFASRDAADAACRALKNTGQECLVTRP